MNTSLGSFDVLLQDVRYAWRAILRSPGFTATVALTFALGVGLNSATFSVLDRIYLRAPEGVADPGSIRRIWFQRSLGGPRPSLSMAANVRGNASYMENHPFPMFRAIDEAFADSLELAVTTTQSARLGGTLRGAQTRETFATANYFSLLGVRPARGRFYTAEEDRLGSGANVVVLSDRYWRAHLAGDTAIVGRSIRFGTTDYTVIGIAPPAFTGIELLPVDVWMPMAVVPQGGMRGRLFEHPGMYTFKAFTRVPDHLDTRAFDVRATAAVLRTHRELNGASADTSIRASTGPILQARGPGEPFQEWVISTRMAGVSAIVLIIACANVVNLLLARAVRRRREIAVRLAVGISRGRLVRLLTTETVLIAAIAGAAALLAGWWGGTLLRSLLFPEMAWPGSAMHWRVAVFTAGVALISGLIAGVIPAIQFSKPSLSDALKEGAREGTLHRSRLRNSLLAAQAALSLVLLVGAALFVRSLRNVQGLDLGFDSRQLFFGRVVFESGKGPEDPIVTSVLDGVEQQLRARPGIGGVARVMMAPMGGMSFYSFFWGPGGVDSSASLRGAAYPVLSVVSPEFFATAGIRVLGGTVFEARSPTDVVVNDAMARLLWPGAEALGQCIYLSSRQSPCRRVVGVVETVRRAQLIEEPSAQWYVPAGAPPGDRSGANELVVRANPGSEPAARAELASALRAAFPDGDVSVRAMTENLDRFYRPWRLGATLFSAFGLLALVVAVVGVYSTMSYSVGQRTHEFGVRMALGAQVRDVLNLVLTEGLRVVGIGVVVGIALVLASGKVIAALLYGVEPTNLGTILAMSLALLIAGGMAALLPAWRGARVDPSVALRQG